MPPEDQDISENGYSIYVGLIFIFNLIVGTGALTLPSIFYQSGWLLGALVTIFLAFISYVTLTFVIESIACTSAISKWKRIQLESDLRAEDTNNDVDSLLDSFNSENNQEHDVLLSRSFYTLDKKIEIGEMASIFFNDIGRTCFYVCLITYLYGDLSIYSAAVSKSIRDVFCHSLNISNYNQTIDNFDNLPCFSELTFTRLDAYRLSLITFTVLIGPFAFFNVQKTKYIQITTVCFRWLAFVVMVIIAIIKIALYGPQGKPAIVNYNGLSALFGASIYSFMCHHSLPALIAPIKNKNNIKVLIGLDYFLIYLFYILLAMTGIFAFSNLEDLYTLNFIPDSNSKVGFLKIVEYFLALFPVFTLSASFPIIAITLRNNLQTLFFNRIRMYTYRSFIKRVIFPLLSILPPIILTYFTKNITYLIGFTGSYAGASIQYFIPAILVYLARRGCRNLIGDVIENIYRSPFQSNMWILFVLIWGSGCLFMITIKFYIF